jgi:hypothetical protein
MFQLIPFQECTHAISQEVPRNVDLPIRPTRGESEELIAVTLLGLVSRDVDWTASQVIQHG